MPLYGCQLSGVSEKETKKSPEALKNGEKGTDLLTAQPTNQEILFSTLLFGISALPHYGRVNGNPQKSHGQGLLILIRLLLQPPRTMSLSELSQMGTPRGLLSLAPRGSVQA